MRSPLGTLARAIPVNKAPVSYAPRKGSLLGGLAIRRGDPVAQMEAMGSVGTLFAIVNRSSNATSQVHWELVRTANGRGRISDAPRPVTSHAALDLVNKPNPHMTGQLLFEVTQQHIDLVGEGWWIVVRAKRAKIPLELWPVRPDRMEPVPHPTEFISGYVYHGPDGEKVPLEVDDVIRFMMPNPLDPYRGMGPVQAILADIDSSKYSAEWNRNFFINSAEPGGIIELDKRLDDGEWKEFTTRWREQHQGVAQAHRVAVLEHGGKWVDRKFSMRDMQFEQLRNVSRDIIREAFGFSKTMLGQTEDVNRATAEAAEYVFTRWHLKPRLERFKAALNNDLLPMYGQPGSLEFAYEDPTPEDAERENAQRDSQVNATVALVGAGYDPDETLEAFGLPEITFVGKTAPEPPEPPPANEDSVEAFADALRSALNHNCQHNGHHQHRHGHRQPRGQVDDAERAAQLAAVQGDWQSALNDLLADWAGVTASQRVEILNQVEQALDNNDIAGLANITVNTVPAAQLLTAAMTGMTSQAAQRMVAEAASQGVEIDPVDGNEDRLSDHAEVTAGLLGSGLAASAAREALRRSSEGLSAREVTEQVREFLEGLSGAQARDQLGGALSNAQNAGRIATLRAAPEAAYYADERLDSNTCTNCEDIDGVWLGNDIDRVEAQYPNGGFVDCLGRERCRGTVVVEFRPEQVDG